MSELHNNSCTLDGRLTRIADRARHLATDLATQASVLLTPYSAEEREQIAELLRILSSKPGDAEKGGL
jgi:hypothetical protein